MRWSRNGQKRTGYSTYSILIKTPLKTKWLIRVNYFVKTLEVNLVRPSKFLQDGGLSGMDFLKSEAFYKNCSISSIFSQI